MEATALAAGLDQLVPNPTRPFPLGGLLSFSTRTRLIREMGDLKIQLVGWKASS